MKKRGEDRRREQTGHRRRNAEVPQSQENGLNLTYHERNANKPPEIPPPPPPRLPKQSSTELWAGGHRVKHPHPPLEGEQRSATLEGNSATNDNFPLDPGTSNLSGRHAS